MFEPVFVGITTKMCKIVQYIDTWIFLLCICIGTVPQNIVLNILYKQDTKANWDKNLNAWKSCGTQYTNMFKKTINNNILNQPEIYQLFCR